MWVIENLDNAGEGMFVCDAPSLKAAMKLHDKKNPKVTVTAHYKVIWMDLALVSGGLGESYYYNREQKRK